MLDSSLTLTPPQDFPWGMIRVSGTLTSINLLAPFDWEIYRRRDQELAYRDIVTATYVATVAVEISTIWNMTTPRPHLAVPADDVITTTDRPEIGRASCRERV